MKITDSYSDITNWFFGTLQILLEKQETVMVGLGGGSSFDSWYWQLMTNEEWRMNNEELLKKIRWCVTDERVNCDTSDRNDAHIWEVFLWPLFEKYSIPEGNFIRPTMESDGREYGERIRDLDIAFFGMGPDGHTASLFPHHPAIQLEELWFIKIDNAPKLPPERISLSPKSIQSLPHVCLFAVWESKKEALANFLNETMSTDDCPVKLLKPEIVYTSIKY
jgi:6-phosphogluconolactonase